MKIIYFSKNMEKYGGAFYQQDVIDELKNQHQVFLYGPGHKDYNHNDSLQDIIRKSNFKNVDLLCVGHAWLADDPNSEVDPHPKIIFSNITTIPKAIILNKEYTNLESKLRYIREGKFDIAFTHHHDTNYYQEKTGTKFIFWPFAVNPEQFKDYGLDKKYDLTFTGILRNPSFPEKQRDTRIKIQKKMFHTIGELRLFKKRKYKNIEMFWQAKPSSNFIQKINKTLHSEKRLPAKEYFKHLNQARICLNTLSPLDLVGTRYYEAMASKSMVFCEESDVYQNLFEENKHYVSFKPGLSDFDEKLFYYIKNRKARNEIVENAYNYILKNHTWKQRINDFIKEIIKI